VAGPLAALVNVSIMVDVPWPWWVTTAAALAAALGSGLAFWRLRNAAARGALALLAIQCCLTAAIAPFLMPSDAGGGDAMSRARGTPAAAGGVLQDGGMGMGMAVGAGPEEALSELPFAFVFARYDRPASGVIRYGSDGRAVATARDGSRVALMGAGGWDATTGRADGGGSYELADSRGGFERGSWRAKRLVSFVQLPGWISPETKEEGRQGLPSSRPFSGRLEVEVALDGLGTGILTAWSAMSAAARRALGRRMDGFTLVGANFRFTDPRPNWRTTARGEFEGAVMFFGPETRSER
jgi:hypothetical protein